MKRTNFFSLFLGIGALVFALGMNYRYVFDDYGIKTNTLTQSVCATVSGDESGSGSSDESGSGETIPFPYACEKRTCHVNFGIPPVVIVKDGYWWKCIAGNECSKCSSCDVNCDAL